MRTLFLTTPNLILGALLAAVTVAGFAFVPESASLPIHWGLSGEADAFAPRAVALALPVLMILAVGAILALAVRFGAGWRVGSGLHVLRATFTALLVVALGIAGATVLIGMGRPVDMVQVISVCVAVLLVLLGNVLPKSQPNGFAGLRIPSTLSDAANWQATHRLVGVLMMIGGLVLGLAALMGAAPTLLFAVLLAAILLPIAAGTAFSMRFARR